MIIYFLIQLAQDRHIVDYKCIAYLSRYVWKKPLFFSIASRLTYSTTIVLIASTFLTVLFYSVVQPSLPIPTVLMVLNLVYPAKIIVYSMAPDGIPVSASKCLVTRYWRERLIEINPRDLWKSLGHNSSLAALDLPLRVEFRFENPFTAYHLPSDWPWHGAEKILPHKLFEFLCARSFPVPSVPPRHRFFVGG